MQYEYSWGHMDLSSQIKKGTEQWLYGKTEKETKIYMMKLHNNLINS